MRTATRQTWSQYITGARLLAVKDPPSIRVPNSLSSKLNVLGVRF
jgi:hypothetical protein